MKVVFCGTPQFAVPALAALLAAGHELQLVLTQPDKPVGRKQEMQASAVKQCALAHALRVMQPVKLKLNGALRAELQALAPDVIVVVAYGRILPRWMLDLPRLGCLNVHGSLLPKYRGAAPIQWAIASGERVTGVTIMRLDEGLDTGDVFLSRALPIEPDATSADLYPALAALGAEMLAFALSELEAGTVRWAPQDHAQATLAPILTREDGRLDLTRSAQQIYDRWRGFTPWPGCWSEFRGKRFLLLAMKPVAFAALEGVLPGTLILEGEKLLMNAVEDSALQLDEVQMEGKARMSGAAFYKDFQVKAGERVG